MGPSKDWINLSKFKANQILLEVNETIPLKLPIPIDMVVKTYLQDVQLFKLINERMNQSISACATKDMVDGWIILLNANECLERQRFSLAHELGHIALIPNQSETVYCGLGNGWEEKLCDRFAGDILMPEIAVRTVYNKNPYPYLENIAGLFQVSTWAMSIQLKRLNLPYKTLNDHLMLT